MTTTNDDARDQSGAGTTVLPLPTQRAAEPSTKLDASALRTITKVCVNCGRLFTPRREHYRKCVCCTQQLTRAQVELVKQRTQDGVRMAQLREHLDGLLRGDPAALAWHAAWLEDLRREFEGSK